MILLDYWLFGRTVLVNDEAALAGGGSSLTRAVMTDTIIRPKSENLTGFYSHTSY